jgi:hypothetical protein
MAKLNSPPRTPPESDLARLAECVRVCEVSRASRQQKYRNLRSWYESGSADGSPSRYNKLFAHINVVGSFIFSPGTVRFGVHLPPQVRKEWMAPSIIARDEFRQLWEESASDTLIDGSLEWSLVYGGTIVKVQPDYPSGFRLGYIQPWDFGVSREDVRDLDDQDTICHWYTLSLPQIERWVGQESVG